MTSDWGFYKPIVQAHIPRTGSMPNLGPDCDSARYWRAADRSVGVTEES